VGTSKSDLLSVDRIASVALRVRPVGLLIIASGTPMFAYASTMIPARHSSDISDEISSGSHHRMVLRKLSLRLFVTRRDEVLGSVLESSKEFLCSV
jgi:hypothetical protein